MNPNMNPFQPFIVKMNTDLASWLARQRQTKTFLNDYTSTLAHLTQDFNPHTPTKLLVDHGNNIYSKGKTVDDKVVIRVKTGLFVEMEQKQAVKAVKELMQLYEQKAKVCEEEVAKIMTTMREVEGLMEQYSRLGME